MTANLEVYLLEIQEAIHIYCNMQHQHFHHINQQLQQDNELPPSLHEEREMGCFPNSIVTVHAVVLQLNVITENNL